MCNNLRRAPIDLHALCVRDSLNAWRTITFEGACKTILTSTKVLVNIVHVEAGAATVMPASCKALCTHTTDTYNNYIYYLTCCRQRLWTERPRGMVLHIDTDIYFLNVHDLWRHCSWTQQHNLSLLSSLLVGILVDRSCTAHSLTVSLLRNTWYIWRFYEQTY